ncbi:MAG TPA: putative Ig domain-containing protein [Candidatus Acidoferrum sp.]|nr:putative Ig domain-containing protein [Candidatus Acidoferrum sp.]
MDFPLPDLKQMALFREMSSSSLRRFILVFAAGLAVILLSSCGNSGSSITIQILPNGTITIDEGQSLTFNATLANDTSNLGVTWALTGSSCSGNGCGVLSNTTTTSTTFTAPTGLSATETITLTAKSRASSGVTATSTISVVLPPTFNTQSLPNGLNGTPYNQTISVTGGVSPLMFAIASGTLPAGLTMNSTGTILGKPTGSGSTNTFQIKVTDNGNPPITVVSPYTYTIIISPAPTLSIPTASVPAATTNVPYSFRISSQGGIPPFTWTYTGSLPPGLQLDPNTGIISGTTTTTGTFPFSVGVTDSTLPNAQSASANLSITAVNAPPLQITTLSLPQATVATPYLATVQATGGVPPYTWSLVTGQLPPGLTLATQTDGSASISGTPTLETNATFTLQVTDSASASQSTNPPLILTVNPVSNAQSLFNGTYSLLFNGFDADGSVTIIGAITANGTGGITSGTNDSNRVSGIFTQSSYTGSYTFGSDGRGTLTLTSINVRNQQLTTTYQMAIRSDGSFVVVENDTTGTFGTGILKLQQAASFSASSFSGRYAFGFSGRDSNNAPAGMIGSLSADGTSMLSPGLIDLNDAGVYSTQLTLNGTFGVATNGLGRGSASVTYKLPSQQTVTATYSFFFVSNSDLFFMDVDATDSSHPRFAGEMVLQNPNQAFNAAALNGASVVSGNGVNFSGSNTGASAMVGLFTPNGLGSGGFSYDQNSSGTITTSSVNSFPNGSYSVNTNGRASFLNLGPRLSSAYLTAQNTGFFLGGDLAATTGRLENQAPTASFSLQSFFGDYAVGALPPPDNQTAGYSGEVNSTGDSNFTGTLDVIPVSGSPATGQTLAGTYSVDAATGRGEMTTNGANSLFPINLVFYIVSPSTVRLIPTDSNNTHPGVILFDH